MTKYHINSKGEAGQCRAKVACPFGNDDAHFPNKEIARERYEDVMSAQAHYNTQNVYFHSFETTPELDEVLALLSKIGNPLIVGGAVRDSLVGVDSKDVDIEVHDSDLDKIVKALKKEGYAVDEVGKQFGVLKVSKKGVITDLDISVPRRENRVGAHHRGFEVEVDSSMNVTEAGTRRDFTFNAMYYDPNRKVIIDPFDGKKDFENRVLRHVSEKFSEDTLRVLRAMQFASRFGLTVHPETAKLSQELRPTYETLSKERVQEEWAKFLTKGRYPVAGVKALQVSGWDDTEPGLREALSNKNLVHGQLSTLQGLKVEDRVSLGAAMIASHMGEENSEKFIKTIVEGKDAQHRAIDLLTTDPSQLTSSSARKHHALKLSTRGFTFNTYGEFTRRMGDDKGWEIAKLAKADGVGAKPEPDLLAGRDVIPLSNRKPGPWMGELLRKARDNQYDGKFKDKADAMQWLKQELEKL